MRSFLLFFLALAGVVVHAQTATGTVNVPFSYPLGVSAGGYLISTNGTGNSLPPGLTYSPTTGLLSGTPTTAGTYAVSVELGTGVVTGKVTLTVSTTTTPPPPPSPATLFCATDPNPACGVVLTWVAPPAATTTALAVTGYLVFRSTSSTAAVQITAAPITAVTYTDKTIAPSTTYDYYVVSVDAAGTQSAPSNTLQVIVAAAPSVPTPATPTNLTGSVVN